MSFVDEFIHTCISYAVDSQQLSQPRRTMFKVVLFLGSQEVEVVPAGWVEVEDDDSTVCYWPPITKPSAFLKAVRQQMPKSENWGTHKVRCLYECGKPIF